MKIYHLTFEEVLFFATILKTQNIYGFDLNKINTNYEEVDVLKIKENLIKKNYILSPEAKKIDIDESIYNIFKIWNKPEKTVIIFTSETEMMNPKKIFFINSYQAVKMIITENEYTFILFEEHKDMYLDLKNEINLQDFIKKEDEFYLLLNGDNFELLLSNYEEKNYIRLEKELNKLGINYDKGIDLLELITQDTDFYFVTIDYKKNKKSIIKTYSNSKQQVLFKFVGGKLSQKVVLANQLSNNFIRTMLYV